MVLSLFNVEDPKNYMYLATDPHLNVVSGTLQKQKKKKTVAVKEYIFAHIFLIKKKNSRSTSSEHGTRCHAMSL